MLPIPELSVTSLPGPLDLIETSTSILGAEPIDPRDIITYANHERMKRGVAPLRVNPLLSSAAKLRADVILKYQNFSHLDPNEGIELHTALPKVGYSFAYATENIGMGGTTGKDFVNGFMSSLMHRTNLLNPHLVETGAAIVSGPYHQYYVNIAVHLFAIPTKSSDDSLYTQTILEIDEQLSLTRELIAKKKINTAPLENWEKLLIREREILSRLIETLKASEPIADDIVTLIETYNSNWATAVAPSI